MKERKKNLLRNAKAESLVRTEENSKDLDRLFRSNHIEMFIQNNREPLFSQRYRLTEKGNDLLDRE